MKFDLTMSESLDREKRRLFPSDFSESTIKAKAHSRNCIKALTKQIPMEVTEIKTDEYICPACGEENVCGDGPGLIGDYYCPVCGQALFQK